VKSGKVTVVRERPMPVAIPTVSVDPTPQSPAEENKKKAESEPIAAPEALPEPEPVKVVEKDIGQKELSEIASLLSSSSVFGLSASANTLYKARKGKHGEWEFLTESGLSASTLNDNMDAFAKAVHDVAGYDGIIKIITEAKPVREAKPEVRRLAELFRGRVIFNKEEENERQ